MLGALVFLLGYNSVISVFYEYGALTDSYLFAGLIWRNSAPLQLLMPANYGTGSFYDIHFSPFLTLWSWLSQIQPLARIEWFAVFIGSMHAALAMVAIIVLRGITPACRWAACGTVALAGMWAFSGVVSESIAMPHYEFWLPAAVVLFFLLVTRQQFWLALATLLLACSIREDAPIHILALLAPVTLLFTWQYRQHNPARIRQLWALCGVTFLLGIALAVERYFAFEGLHFRSVVLGDPPLAHLSVELLAQRLSEIFLLRPYVWAPLLFMLVWATVARNLLLGLGVLAHLPWLLALLLMRYDTGATLGWYYAFPLLTLWLWPALAWQWQQSWLATPAPVTRRYWYLSAAVLVLAVVASFSPLKRAAHVLSFLNHPGPEIASPHQLLALQGALGHDISALGDLRADQAALGLLGETLKANPHHIFHYPPEVDSKISYLFTPWSYDARLIEDAASQTTKASCYKLRHSRLRLLTPVPIEKLAGLALRLQPLPRDGCFDPFITP